MKIFEVGFGRTGTGSLSRAMQILEFKVLHWAAAFHDDMLRELLEGRLYSCIEKYDYISDCVATRYEELDRAYPGSKFILTVRDENQWLDSFLDHAKRRKLRPSLDSTTLYRLAKFGCFFVESNPARVRESVRRHVRDVQEYFSARPQDLLVLNVTESDSWGKLCQFVDSPVPAVPFPWENARPKS